VGDAGNARRAHRCTQRGCEFHEYVQTVDIRQAPFVRRALKKAVIFQKEDSRQNIKGFDFRFPGKKGYLN